ncbi:hypothetical protein KIN20_007463 [Parelaphostrongylus tenuis]|uniref:Uncharacterized protein n=1 Tax=Parelaphostrongylus tenuis TaxID=148309 RepID=A0AAD5MMA1_PARTN|nr:hypothetical protein KIN20_007463 [Parelaphostrongylus tenuis]
MMQVIRKRSGGSTPSFNTLPRSVNGRFTERLGSRSSNCKELAWPSFYVIHDEEEIHK